MRPNIGNVLSSPSQISNDDNITVLNQLQFIYMMFYKNIRIYILYVYQARYLKTFVLAAY